MPASVEIMKSIPKDLSSGLSIMPVDERFGPVGHDESNWAKLMAASFDAKQANLRPVLAGGLDFEATAKRYNEMAIQAFADSNLVIGQLGLGADGHTAGILPNSPATHVVEATATYYEAPPLRRLTLTFRALKKINVAYVLAFGADKKTALENLKQDISLEQEPAQILKDFPEVYIYNDQLGGLNA